MHFLTDMVKELNNKEKKINKKNKQQIELI